jgi:hypothetical protein
MQLVPHGRHLKVLCYGNHVEGKGVEHVTVAEEK